MYYPIFNHFLGQNHWNATKIIVTTPNNIPSSRTTSVFEITSQSPVPRVITTSRTESGNAQEKGLPRRRLGGDCYFPHPYRQLI